MIPDPNFFNPGSRIQQEKEEEDKNFVAMNFTN